MSPECLAASGPSLIDLGEGQTESGKLPMDACRLFGPDFPPATVDMPAGRPVDPDASGGYYQPVRVIAEGAFEGDVAASARIACGVAGATGDQIGLTSRSSVSNERKTPSSRR